MSVLSTSVPKQARDMVLQRSAKATRLSFGLRTTMLYALERESGSWINVSSSGDIHWQRNRIFISEVIHLEELRVELIPPGFTKSSFETWRWENSMRKSFDLEPHGEWSDFAVP